MRGSVPRVQTRVASEQAPHDAVAIVRELNPNERFGLGRLAVLARWLPYAAGFIDLLPATVAGDS